MSFTLRDYEGLIVTTDGSDRPLTANYYVDSGNTVLITSFSMTYSANGDPIYLGETLVDHVFNISKGIFELSLTPKPPITNAIFIPTGSGVVETGVNIFNIPWTYSVGIEIGTITPVGGTAPFTYSIISDPNFKFDITSNSLSLDDSLNIFLDSSHTVTVEVVDANLKEFDLVLTFNLVSGNFGNASSFDFLGAGENLISDTVNANPTGVPFTISLWYNTSSNNRVVLGRWDNSTECMFSIGFDAARPRVWISGDGTPGNFQGRRTGSSYTSGVWHNLVVTFSASTLNIYADGVLDNGTTSGSAQTSMFLSATQVLEVADLTSANPGGDGPFDGFMDEISFWDVEFTASEVTELYNAGIPTDLAGHSQAANLLEWYRMGDSATVTGIPEVTGGVIELAYANGASISDVSTDVPP